MGALSHKPCSATRQILVQDLCRTYRVAERDAGVLGAMRGLLHRRYREVAPLKSVSFTLERGELLGVIGPNGAGKCVGVVVGQRTPLWWDLPVADGLALLLDRKLIRRFQAHDKCDAMPDQAVNPLG